jgi:ATP-dependent helicase/nuclease subunit B
LTARVFDNPAPRLFTLPPQADFLRAVAITLRTEFGAETNPDALSDLLILTPTRRAARALGDAFAREAGSGVALLPMIRPIGDVDVDDPPFEPGELSDIAPDAITTSQRRFELARLIIAKEAALERPIGINGALALADPLAALLDDLATEDTADLAILREQIHEYLPEDRREAADFLAIIEQAWPARLAELGMIDPATRRSRVLKALADRWRNNPPAHPVLAVGSTGSIPAVRELMKIVANLPLGGVVLPGFDWDADDDAWSKIDDAHPQWAMRDFVDSLDVARNAVMAWPGAAENDDARARRRVIAEALRPADATSDWMSRIKLLSEENGSDFFQRGLTGLSLIETADQLSEARTCALLLRETLDEPDKTAILVTPDRDLARRVSAEMARFGVKLDDSGGAALPETRVAALLIRILDLAQNPGSAIALSSLWGSPLFAVGGERGAVHGVLGKFEAEALRGVRPGPDIQAVIQRLDGRFVEVFDEDRAAIITHLNALDAVMAPLAGTPFLRSAADWATAHVKAAEAIASTDTTDGASRLWRGEGGEAAAALARELLTETQSLPPMTLAEYAAAFSELAHTRRVPPRVGVHPRLQVLGPIEARLIQADRTILAGLNEGVWPAGVGADPWLTRGMRSVLELGAPERRHGLAAHDFAQLAAGGEVFLTRASKVQGSPTIASRWLWRLKTLTRGAMVKAADKALAAELDYPAIARQLDAPTHYSGPAPRPRPCPPVAVRPRKLSITEIRTWVRDPYAIYARHILGLRKLDAADMPPGPRERGTALHEALHRTFAGWSKGLPETAVEELVAEGRIQLLKFGFTEDELSVELPRFERAAQWLIGWEKRRRKRGLQIEQLEIKGRLEIDGPAGPWTLTGRADRFDRHGDGRLDIIDYKTGAPATPKTVAAGFDPQLPLTAAMAQTKDVFPDLDPAAPADLLYVKLSGGTKPGEEKTAVARKSDPVDLAADALRDLKKWVAEFDDVATAYPSQPRAQYVNSYGDYDHLARRAEWASAPGESSEGET